LDHTDTNPSSQNLSLVWGDVDAPRRCQRNVEDESVHGTLLLPSSDGYLDDQPLKVA
jgi:hypothetical protein